MARKRTLIIVAILLSAAIGGAAWSILLRPIKVQVAAVDQDVDVQVFGLGTVEARVASKIGFKVAGVLIDLRADVGERLGKSVVLARLDNREQTARAARAKAAIEQSEATLQRATASLVKAEANYANAKSINERRQKLVQTNSASVESAESAKAAEDVAKADISLAASDMAVARAAISDAIAQQQQETATLEFHTLLAPYDTMITARSKELGAAVAAGEPVFTLIDPASVWVLSYIDESKSGEIKVGDPAEIVLRSRPNDRLRGRVARIEPESDRVNEERRVAVAFANRPDIFNIGEQAEVYISTIRLPKAVLVPQAAIIGLGRNRGTVWILDNSRLRQHQVTFGHRLLDGRYEIKSGLPDGAQVVTQLQSGLRAGRSAAVDESGR